MSKRGVTAEFFEAFSPTTLTMGFVEAPIEHVASDLERWREQIGWRYEKSSHRGIRGALGGLAPLSWPFDRETLVSTRGSWTAYMNNALPYGTDPAPIGELALRCSCRAVEISTIPHTWKAREKAGVPGATRFVVYGPQKTDWVNVERAVSVAFDGGWKFTTIGHPLEFERLDQYDVKSVRDRLTADDVVRMCAKMGIDARDESFFASDALVYAYPDRSRARQRSEDWEAARSRLRLS